MEVIRFSLRKTNKNSETLHGSIAIPAQIRDWLIEKGIQPNESLIVAQVEKNDKTPAHVAIFFSPEDYVEFKKKMEQEVGIGIVCSSHKRGTKYNTFLENCAKNMVFDGKKRKLVKIFGSYN